jgi:hypothetical protein
MPCWLSQDNQIDLTGMTGERLEILKASLAARGYRLNDTQYSAEFGAEFTADHIYNRTTILVKRGVVSIGIAKGTDNAAALELSETKAVKRAYSMELVKRANQRFGWTSTQTAENRMTIERRF